VGKRADLIILETNRPNMTPMHHPESQVVYSAGGGDVGEVVVGGIASSYLKKSELRTK
jgi:5-methylthioadenosine/S-adenosylhomocysteine deaminase